jgi:hypothetical protein
MVTLSDREKSIGRIAASVVQEAGGTISFAKYDRMMFPKCYFAPINWIEGWGLSKREWKQNNDKLAVFAAVRMGLVRQTKTGYELVSGEPK